MLIERALFDVCASASITRMLNVKLPVEAGVPEMIPLELVKLRPGGRIFWVSVHE
jgi:hypothetical protein